MKRSNSLSTVWEYFLYSSTLEILGVSFSILFCFHLNWFLSSRSYHIYRSSIKPNSPLGSSWKEFEYLKNYTQVFMFPCLVWRALVRYQASCAFSRLKFRIIRSNHSVASQLKLSVVQFIIRCGYDPEP